ncbi:MAG: LysE family transporter [Bacteroidota bacterium]
MDKRITRSTSGQGGYQLGKNKAEVGASRGLKEFMNSCLKVCGSGLLISFFGALPLGTLNITAFDIAASQGMAAAFVFSIATIVIELCYVRLTLWGSQHLQLGDRFSYYLLPPAIILLLYLAISSLTASIGADTWPVSHTFPKIASPLLLGILLSTLNPLQIPFWMAWHKILFSRKTLKTNWRSYVSYILGIGLGSLMAMSVFIFAGNNIVANYDRYGTWTNSILGLFYLGFSFYLIFLLYKKHLKLKIQ